VWLSVFGFSLDECRKAGCEKPYHYFTHYVDSAWLRAHPSHSFALEALLIQVSECALAHPCGSRSAHLSL
jgi:hypothetical protein